MRGRRRRAAAASSPSRPWARNAATTPESTSPVPAVARRASPSFSSSTRPSGAATTVVGPLSSTVAPVGSASSRAAPMRSAPGAAPARPANSPSCGVRTVGCRAAAMHARGSRRVAQRDQPVGVDDHRDRGGRHERAHGCAGRLGSTQARTDEQGAEAVELVEHGRVPAARPGSTRPTTSRGGVGTARPGTPRRTMPAPARIAARAQRWAAPVMPGDPATTHTALRHLCASGARAGSHACTSAASTRWIVAPGNVEPDVDQLDAPGVRAPGPRAAARASGPRRSPSRRRTPRLGLASPVSPFTPDGMSTASTGAPPGSGAS